jgi:hypothetical protein
MKKILILMVGIFSFNLATAQEDSFFTDPSLLKPSDNIIFDRRYRHPDIRQVAQRYSAVMLDQPEIFIADDSKYKGAKGDHLKQLTDAARLAMKERLEAGGWPLTDKAGPNVVYLRWAISDLYLQKKKKKRGLLSYTPVGMVVHTTSQATIKDLWEKIDIIEFGLKTEFLDSVSGEVIVAGSAKQGSRKTDGQKRDLVTWQELDALFSTIGEQTRCRLDNNKLPEGKKRFDCDSILIEPDE